MSLFTRNFILKIEPNFFHRSKSALIIFSITRLRLVRVASWYRRTHPKCFALYLSDIKVIRASLTYLLRGINAPGFRSREIWRGAFVVNKCWWKADKESTRISFAEETRKDGATKEPAIFPLSSPFFIDRKIIGRFNELYIHDAGISQIIILFIRKVRIIRYVEMATFVYSISARSYRKSSIKSS